MRRIAIGEIVVLLADLGTGLLQHAGDEADLFRHVHGYEGRCGATVVVQRHVLSEPVENPCANGIVDPST